MRKYNLLINQKKYSVEIKSFSIESAKVEVNNKEYDVKIVDMVKTEAPSLSIRQIQPDPILVPRVGAPVGIPRIVAAPIPGTIIEILLRVGDRVRTGQAILKMEAMKMQMDIRATCDGEIKAISVMVGDTVHFGEELVVID